jgi:hypothetical protein
MNVPSNNRWSDRSQLRLGREEFDDRDKVPSFAVSARRCSTSFLDVMVSPSTHTDHTEWEALVGRALLRFGDIELVSLKCLALIPADKILISAGRLNFLPRINLLIEILEGRPERDANLEAILIGFRQARDLAKIRNLIAHNPLLLDIYVNEDESGSIADWSIKSARSESQSLDLEALKEFAAAVEDLSSELWMAFMRLDGTASALWRTHPMRKHGDI